MRHYQALNGRLRAGLPEHGIQTCFGARRRSCSLTVAALPSGQTSDELYDALLDRGFVVYHAKGNLRERCVLVANMGYLHVETIDRFLDAVAAVVPAGTR
jgi:aspartate aminotransferase-like enzyme